MKLKHNTLIFLAGATWLIIGIFLLSLGIHFILETIRTPLLTQIAGSFSIIAFVEKFTPDRTQAILWILCFSLLVGYLKGKMVLAKSVYRQVNRIESFPKSSPSEIPLQQRILLAYRFYDLSGNDTQISSYNIRYSRSNRCSYWIGVSQWSCALLQNLVSTCLFQKKPFMIQGLGTDIIEIGRIQEALERHGDRFLDKLFTAKEKEYCFRYSDAVRHFAGRFAAKEAILKAFGTGLSPEATWQEIEILNNEQGKPEVYLSSRLQETFSVANILLSISHCTTFATATAILLRKIR